MKTRASRFSLVTLSACAGAVLLTTPLRAAPPVPPNLSGGLDAIVSSNVALQKASGKARNKMATFQAANGRVYLTEQAAQVANDAISSDDGRIMVRAHLNGLFSVDDVGKAIASRVPSFTVVAVDGKYKGGVIEGLVSEDDVPSLAYTTGVGTVALELKPELYRATTNKADRPITDVVPGQTLNKLGTAFDQGVFQHRVDNINKFYNPSATLDYEGAGISIGFISDSYNSTGPTTSPTASVTNASMDVANFDLPGDAANPVNKQAVVVLQEGPTAAQGASDEGRGMGQIIYKMAPKARIAFATAFISEVGFANNIRALAGLPGFTYPSGTQQGFAADVICDDVGYGDEPFFEDGIVGTAVDDVAAAGVAYFSSAGNDIGTYDYDSDLRPVPVSGAFTAGTLKGTNISLAGVPSNLYQGGFHNYRTDGGTDLAMTVNVPATPPSTNFQWDDPFNQTVPVIQPAIYHNSAVHDGSTTQHFTFPSLTAGTKYVLNVTAQPGSLFDAIVTVKDPNGVVVVDHQDTGTDETVAFTATVNGPYSCDVDSFDGTTGAYNVDLYLAAPSAQVTTDFNLLVFDLNGNYLPNSSLKTNNLSSNVPIEFGRTRPKPGETQVQYVICRANNPPASPQPAGHFRWIIRGNGAGGIGPAEYFTYNTPNTKGHAMAKGCNGTAAFSVFRPSQIPEFYTSPGPATVYFDKTGNRLSTPDVRLQPSIGASDNGNTSFFAQGGDSASDLDTNPNFAGTSAAAPHAAGIAALVLEAKGGRMSVTPAQMKNLLQRSTFPHDLDPNSASGSARTSLGGKVSIRIDSDRGLNPSAGAFNPNSITVSYVGPGSLSTLDFNPAGTAATGGAPTAGNNGLDNSNTYFSNIYPGIIFQPLPAGGRTSGTFVFGNGSVGLTPADVTASMSNPAPPPSNGTTQFWTLNLAFPTANFTGGKALRFTTGHAQQHDSTVTTAGALGPTGGVTGVNTTQADLFGGGVLIPDGTITQNGLFFSGTTSSGGTFSGFMRNRIGAGWTPTEGFGFINAQAAVSAPVQ